jgi:hypothetical protein
MTRIPSWLVVIIPGMLAALSGAAISAQDKYSLSVPGGLSFAEFKGYDGGRSLTSVIPKNCSR